MTTHHTARIITLQLVQQSRKRLLLSSGARVFGTTSASVRLRSKHQYWPCCAPSMCSQEAPPHACLRCDRLCGCKSGSPRPENHVPGERHPNLFREITILTRRAMHHNQVDGSHTPYCLDKHSWTVHCSLSERASCSFRPNISVCISLTRALSSK